MPSIRHLTPLPGAALALWIVAISGTRITLAEPASPREAFESAERHRIAGDLRGEQRRLIQLLEQLEGKDSAERTSHLPEAELALRRLHRLAFELGDYGEARETLERWGDFETGPAKEHPQVAALSRFFAAGASLLSGPDPDRAEELLDDLGLLRRWWVVGPFDNERGGGYERSHSPEADVLPDPEKTHEGKSRPVSWRPLSVLPASGMVDLRTHFRPAEQSLAYLKTFLRSETEQVVALRLATSGAYRIWVNGREVARKRLQRPFSFDQDGLAIRLREGWNSITIKSLTESGAWSLRARISRLDGGPASGWEEASPDGEEGLPPSIAEAGEAPAPVVEEEIATGAREILDRRLGSGSASAHDPYLSGLLFTERHPHDRTSHPDREAFRQAIQAAGDGVPGGYHLQLGRSHRRLRGIEADRDDNAWRHALEASLKASPPAIVAHVELGEYYLDTFGNTIAAERHARAALAARPDLARARQLLARVHGRRGHPGALERTFLALEAELHPPVEVLRVRASRLADHGEDIQAEDTLRTILRKNLADTSTRDQLVRFLLERQRVDDALAVLGSQARSFPFDTSAPEFAATILRGQGRLPEAVAVRAGLVRLCPDDADLHRELGDLVQLLGDRAGALAHYREALRLRPNNPGLQEYVDYLESRVDALVLAHRRPVDELIARAHEETFSRDDPARTLLVSTAVKVNFDGTTREFHQEVFQVTNERGLEIHKHYRSHYARGDQQLEYLVARVVHPDGSESRARLQTFRGGRRGSGEYAAATVELPPLEVGDIVEVQFVQEDLHQSFFGDYFGRRESFQTHLPIEEKVFVLRAPADRELHFHYRNLDLAPRITTDDRTGERVYTWLARDIEKIRPEPGMPPATESAPLLEISTFESWKEFNDWYWNLIREQHESSPEIRARVRELTSGLETRREKIRALYNYVAQKVRYNAWEFGVHGFKPYNAPAIFARSFGDCKDKATLLSVMLSEVGIESHPVLIYATPTRGEEDLTLPMVNHFNHCITYVPPGEGEEELYLDGTALYNRLEELPSSDRGAEVLVVKPRDGELRKIPWNPPRDLSIVEDLQIDLHADGSATLEIRGEAVGDLGASLRSAFEIPGKRQRTLERIFGSRHAGVEILEQEFSPLGELLDPVRYRIRLSVPRLLTESPEGLSLPPPEDFFQTGRLLQGLGSLQEREHDLLLGPPRLAVLTATVHLPPTLRAKSLPESLKIAERFGQIVVEVEAEENRIELHRRLELTTHRISQEEYPAFRDLANDLQRKLEENWILMKKEEA